MKLSNRLRGLSAFFLIVLATAVVADDRSWLITMTWQPQAQFAGIYYAKEAGIFAKYGLNVEINHKTPELAIVDYLTRKRSEFIVAALGTALVERSKGIPLVNICQINQESNAMLVGSRKSGIAHLKDLKTLTAANKPRRFGIWEVDFGAVPLAFLRQHGVDGEIVPVNTDIALLLWGAVDVICAMEYNEFYQLLAAGYESNELVYFRMRDYQLNIPEDGLYTLDSIASANPKICRAMRKAVIEGWRAALANPEQALQYVRMYCERNHSRFDPAQQRWMLTIFGKSLGLNTTHAGSLAPAAYDFAVRIFKRYGFINKNVDYRDFCPNLGEGDVK
ncbi:MAG: ABC transporter substrate-binding protein [Victivallales bacterium]|jgi:NitT/TauT family transport system substrate-binding protein|nr:ABC transporter substrate-binding protein [Victivallales bacterium]